MAENKIRSSIKPAASSLAAFIAAGRLPPVLSARYEAKCETAQDPELQNVAKKGQRDLMAVISRTAIQIGQRILDGVPRVRHTHLRNDRSIDQFDHW
jgi:hypothetical protein